MDKYNNARYKQMYDAETTFESWWEDIMAFAEENRISTSYVEEEFIIDGTFIPVHLEWYEDQEENG